MPFHLVVLSAMIWLILRSGVICIFSDGCFATSDSQTAGRSVFHSWPAQICRPGQHGDESRPKPATSHLLWLLLSCHHGKLKQSIRSNTLNMLFHPLIFFILQLHQNSLQPAVIPAMLQVIFDKANLSDPSVNDSVVWQWLHVRLRPLLFNLSPDHVAPFFSIMVGRNCSIQLQG